MAAPPGAGETWDDSSCSWEILKYRTWSCGDRGRWNLIAVFIRGVPAAHAEYPWGQRQKSRPREHKKRRWWGYGRKYSEGCGGSRSPWLRKMLWPLGEWVPGAWWGAGGEVRRWVFKSWFCHETMLVTYVHSLGHNVLSRKMAPFRRFWISLRIYEVLYFVFSISRLVSTIPSLYTSYHQRCWDRFDFAFHEVSWS